jgi:hypothetical protein
MEWYYAKEGQAVGPVVDVEFQKLIRTGTVSEDTLVWHEGMANWAAFGSLSAETLGKVRPRLRLVETADTVTCERCGKELPAQEAAFHAGANLCPPCASSAPKGAAADREPEGAAAEAEAASLPAQAGDLVALSEPLFGAKGWIRFAGVLSIIHGALCVLSLWGIVIAWLPIWMGVLLCKTSGALRTAHETGNAEEFRGALQRLATYFRILGVVMLVGLVVGLLAMLAAIAIPALLAARLRPLTR